MNSMSIIKKHSRFKEKVYRGVTFTVALGLLLTFIATTVIEYHRENQHMINTVEVLSRVIGNRSVAALVFNDRESGQANLGAVKHYESIELACLYDQEGLLFSEYIRPPFSEHCKPNQESPGKHEIGLESRLSGMELSMAIVDAGEVMGHIHLYASKRAIHASLMEYGGVIILVFLAIWVIISQVAKSALHTIMHPLEDLHTTARGITLHTLSDTRAKKISNDEVGELVGVFNQMLDSIERESKALTHSESRFRSLADNSPVGIFQKNQDGALLYANNMWHKLSGLQRGATADEFAENILDTYLRHYKKSWDHLKDRKNTEIIEFAYRNKRSGNINSFMEYVSAIHTADGVLQGYIGTLLDVTELKNAQIELEKLAFYDPLTGLPNRRFFRDHLNYILAEAKRNRGRVAIMMLDLDNFKKVNDTLGHDTGDHLLKIVSERMKSAVSESCVVSRMGGDEFLFLLNDADAEEAASLAQEILENISRPAEISGHTVEVGGSFGITVYPADALSAHDLIKNADMALYNAKENGRNHIKFYSSKLDSEIRETLYLEERLLQAIKQEDLLIYLQPQYSTQKRKFVWAEALLRWPDNNGGFIPPGKFIPLAENIGVIHKLGYCVIEKSCIYLRDHRRELQDAGIEGISINLSASEFFSSNFLSYLREVLSATAVSPSSLDFEITESIVINDANAAIRIMNALRDLGCRLSIDDFGTGYSSLSYLKRFPINTLKIDQSFVTDIPYDKSDVEICTAIIAMAHKLGLSVVAEGVETVEQRDFLIDQGCEILQGYLFARPREISDYIKPMQKGLHDMK